MQALKLTKCFLNTENRYNVNLAVTGGNGGCHNDNPRSQQQRQSLHHNDSSRFSVKGVNEGGHLNHVLRCTHLSVCVLNGRDVALSEGPPHEAQDKGAFADTAGSEHDDTVVIRLLRHHPEAHGTVLKDR